MAIKFQQAAAYHANNGAVPSSSSAKGENKTDTSKRLSAFSSSSSSHSSNVADPTVSSVYKRSRQEESFEVDLKGRVIHLSKEKYEQADEILPQALGKFPGKVYLKLDPFGVGAQFFCFRNQHQKIEGATIDKNSSSHGDLQSLETLQEIQADTSYTKIQVQFDLKKKKSQ